MKRVVTLIVATLVTALVHWAARAQDHAAPLGPQKLAAAEIQFDFLLSRRQYHYDVRFKDIESHSKYSTEELRAILVTSVFARSLVAHEETRRLLLEKARELSQQLIQNRAFKFDKWNLEAGGMTFAIYPWQKVSGLHSGKIATATLTIGVITVGLSFDVPLLAPTRIVFPGIPIHLAEAFCAAATEKGRYQLGLLLDLLVRNYEQSGDFSIGSDTAFLTWVYRRLVK
jgi:hypothetical protein